MAKDNTTTADNTPVGQSQNSNPGTPLPGGFDYTPEAAAAGREYGKELARWSGRQLRIAGRRLKNLFIRVTTRIPKWKLNDVDTDELKKRMAKINWNKDYYSAEAIARSERSPRLQRDIMRVNRIFRDLNKLSDSRHYMGEELRWKLQYKYWTNTRMQSQTGNTLGAVLPPGNYPPSSKANIQGNSQAKGERMTTGPSMGNTMDAAQKRKENEARRFKVAYGGSRLSTSSEPRQHRRKRGLGL